MSTILNFNLSHTASLITEIICLFDPAPAFQYQRNADFSYSITTDDKLIRDTSVASAGFNASDISAPSTKLNLPSNAYSINFPSKVYNTPSSQDTYSVVLVNSALAKVEPGFSRVRITYSYYDAGSGTVSSLAEYFDCPFYEGFNVTARELNNLKDYIEEANSFLQKEIDIITTEVQYALSREFWRGTSVSGKLSATPISTGLQTGPLTRGEFAHSMNSSKSLAALSSAAFGPGTGSITITRPTGGTVEQYFSVPDGNGCQGIQEGYFAEGVDSNGQRVIVLVDSSNNTNSFFSAVTHGFYFTSDNGVDSIVGPTTDKTYFNLHAYIDGTPESAGIQKLTNANDNLGQYIILGAPGVNGHTLIGASTGVAQYAYNSASNYVYSPPSTGTFTTNYVGYQPVQTAVYDTVSYNGANIPRVIWYPPNNTNTITLADVNSLSTTQGTGGSAYGKSNDTPLNLSLNLISATPPASPPVITSVSSTSGCVGQSVSISGANFNGTRDTANINNTPATLNVTSTTTATVVVPSTAAGPTTLTISDGVNPPTSSPFTVLGQPNLTSVSPTQAPPGAQVTLNGTNFGTQDGNSAVYINNVSGVIVSWTDTAVVITVPNTTAGATQIRLHSDCGDSSSAQFIVSSSDSLAINPHTATVTAGSTFQFNAVFYQGSNGTNVSSGANTVWFVNNVIGGESTHGTITQSGLYAAPGSTPPSPIVVSVQYFDSAQNKYLTDSAQVQLSPAPQLTIAPANTTLNAGQQQQYAVTLVVGGASTDVTSSSSYAVNGTPGGDIADGTITSGGLYTAPGNLTSATVENITASYSYMGTIYNATAVATVNAVSSDHSNITVTSQLNVFLGDGRFGYVPVGTQLIAYPNQYVFVQFVEQLDLQNHLPVASYLPVQQLGIQVKDALDGDIANVIYNLADKVYNPDGTTNTKRTVVLGILDPSDGLFHSMWDIANPSVQGPDVDTHGIELSKALFAEDTKAFKGNHSFTGSITDYVNDLAGGGQTQLDALNARTNILLTGNCSYDSSANTFKILDSLHILGISSDKSYGILGLIPSQEIKLEPNQYLFIDETKTLKVGNFADVFLEGRDAKTIVVGAVLDKFYTTWPLLKMLDVDTSNVKDFGADSFMQVGPLLIQWGLSEQYTIAKKSATTNKIKFPVSFNKSCIVLTEAQNSEGGFPNAQTENTTTEDFDAKLINLGNMEVTSRVSWIALGM